MIRVMTAEPIGRERESGLLDGLLDLPADGLRVVLLTGEPGIGKSTLWERAIAAGRQRSNLVLTSRPAETERGHAFLVLGDLFRDVEPSLVASMPIPRRRAFEAALLLGDDPGASVDSRALGVAVTTILESLARQGTVLIAIDDDQWADEPSAQTLAFAVRRLTDRPITLLLARRTHDQPPVRLEGLVEPVAVERLEVGPLSMGATQVMLRDRLGITFARPTLRELHRVAGGNPFYALELGRARLRDASRDLALPLSEGSVDGLLQARIRELDGATTRALLLVAAHGRASIDLLVSLDIDAGVIERAVDAGLLVRTGDVLGCAHPVLAAAVYEGAGGEGRRAAHRLLAGVIEDEVSRGRHAALGAAGPSRSISAELEAAGRIARERGQSLAAADLAEHAARLTPAADLADRHRRTIAAARARLDAGDGARARVIVSRLMDVTQSGTRRAEGLLLASDLETPATAVELLEEALRAAGSEPHLRALIHARLASQGRLTRGRTWAERHVLASLRLASTLADDRLMTRALAAMALLRFDGADPEAPELADRAYRLARRSNDDTLLKDAAITVGHLLVWSGDGARARSWLTDQLATWRDRDELMQADCLWYLALVELSAGRWTVATERADQARDIRTQYGLELPQDHLPAALIALHQGRFDLAARHSERALARAEGMVLPAHLAVLATIESWTGDPGSAIVGFERAEAAADVRGFDEPALRSWRAEYAECLLRTGRVDDADRLVTIWADVASRVGRKGVSAGAARLRGLIAVARGDLVAAGQLLEDAAAQHESAGDRFGWARAELAIGIVHRRLRRKRLARLAFDAAVRTFDDLGAASWAAQSRAELTRLGGRQRIEGMSPSERRVAELVAEGRTNRDVAAALFVTERTVASHLTRVYAKLGVRSRTELARLLTERGGNVPTS
jgi:DNA-binding CsgD family transcriptional regulator